MTMIRKGCGAEIPGGHAWPEHSCADCSRLGIFLETPDDDDITILEEAATLTAGDRLEQYGPPLENARRFAQLANAATGLDILPEHMPVLMICVKLARLGGPEPGFQRDTWVDIAGYARVAEMMQEARP